MARPNKWSGDQDQTRATTLDGASTEPQSHTPPSHTYSGDSTHGPLGREWELRVQELEDEEDEDEPGLWTRVRSLLLNLSLQLYHRLSKVREQLMGAMASLGAAADTVRWTCWPSTLRYFIDLWQST